MTVKLTQKTGGWQNTFEFPANLGQDTTKELTAEQTVTFTYTEADGISVDIKLTK